MIETILYLVLVFGGGVGGGYLIGKNDSTITVDCKSEPLIITQCVDIHPPKDDSFGSTTESYISLIDTYKKCKTACVISIPNPQ